MKVLEGSYFQKEPPPLVLRYSNLLSEIRELFATWTPSRKIPEFSSEKFSGLKLDSWPDSKQYYMDVSKRLGRRKIVTLKTSWRRLEDLFWRRLEDISWRCLEDISWRRLELKTWREIYISQIYIWQFWGESKMH